MQDLISIIIPIYKVPTNYLKKCINSCIVQDFKNIEILLIDDGSPDECGYICDSFKSMDKRIKVIHQNNRGLSGARNTGFNEAKGKWIMFLDGDDYLENNCCSTLIHEIEDDIDVLCFTSYRDNLRERLINKTKLQDGYIYKYENRKLKMLTLDFNAHISTSWAKLLRRSFLIENNIYHNEELRQGAEGIEYCIRLFDKANVVKYIDKPLYNYIYNENSISAIPTEDNNYYVLKCFNVIKSNIDNSDFEMMNQFYERMGYVVVTTIVSGYFNPRYKDKYSFKKKKLKKYLKEELVINTLDNISKNLDYKRKTILYLTKFHFFGCLYILSKLYKK